MSKPLKHKVSNSSDDIYVHNYAHNYVHNYSNSFV